MEVKNKMDKLQVKFNFTEVNEFEEFLEKVFKLMNDKEIPRANFEFNESGKKQYDKSFPEIKE